MNMHACPSFYQSNGKRETTLIGLCHPQCLSSVRCPSSRVPSRARRLELARDFSIVLVSYRLPWFRNAFV